MNGRWNSAAKPLTLIFWFATLPVSHCIQTCPMNDARVKRSKVDIQRNSFITIDDLGLMAEDLLDGIIRLSEYKYPLDVRKGGKNFRKEVIDTPNQSIESETIKARSQTYFFDIRKTKEGKPYLTITESRLSKEAGKEPQRSTIFIFPEDAENIKKTFSEMIEKIR